MIKSIKSKPPVKFYVAYYNDLASQKVNIVCLYHITINNHCHDMSMNAGTVIVSRLEINKKVFLKKILVTKLS